MPELSRFFGVVVTMYADDHNPPHFHVRRADEEALFNIVDGVFMKGSLPSKESRLVLAWYEIHKDELMDNWNALLNGKPYTKIKPLE